ncbi:MAG: CUAEP/CCAEP-tail radical SAM protein [Anaerolineae bacterium]|nr:CUAEP/CCAEP-tail radical SAM protein [Anaerolineae bacterium]
MTAPPTNNLSEILLLSTYELGHQPLSLASPLAYLHQAGFNAQVYDLSRQDFPAQAVAQASFVGIAVPMHTALRLGVQAAAQVRKHNPDAHICFYGLYAWLNAEYLLSGYADSVIAGEYEQPLLDLIALLQHDAHSASLPGVYTLDNPAQPHLARLPFPIPQRSQLPTLESYAHYTDANRHTLAGYTEASRGCLHTCSHCPVVPVYHGRFFIVPLETVLADIRQQVAAGAGHISFGDPDFLNGPGHALKVAQAVHAEFPALTFDITVKVEHILQHRDIFPQLRQLGCTFVISAFEAASDHILERLGKGHTAEDMQSALQILAQAGTAVQPTWMPFTPWTSLQDYLDLLTWIREQDIIPHVPAVQLSVRMLVPPHSALLDHADTSSWLGDLDSANFSYTWAHPDPRMDALQRQVAQIAEANAGGDPYQSFAAIEALAFGLAGMQVPIAAAPAEALPSPPRLTEDWFC